VTCPVLCVVRLVCSAVSVIGSNCRFVSVCPLVHWWHIYNFGKGSNLPFIKFRCRISLNVNFEYEFISLSVTVFSGLQVAPEYKPHPLFLPKIWGKFIDKSHLSISRTLFCYFLARRNVLGCIHVMRRLAKEWQDAIDVVQKTLNAGLIAWAKVCGDAVI